MNQAQRQYLVEQIDFIYRKQVEVLKDQIPKKPSLNNYLIAAFLDNSIEFADIDQLKKLMRERVLKFGSGDALIESEESYRRKSLSYVQLVPEELFIIPEAYQKELEQYEHIKDDIEKQIADLEALKRTLIMKIQIGSAKALDNLVEQVDNITDLKLTNFQLKLTDGTK